MRRILLLCLVIILTMLGGQGFVTAQSDTQLFISPDESLTFQYPSNWFVYGTQIGFVFVNEETNIYTDFSVDLDETAVIFGAILPQVLESRSLPATANPTDAVNLFAPEFFSEHTTEPVTFGDNSGVLATGTSLNANEVFLYGIEFPNEGTVLFLAMADNANTSAFSSQVADIINTAEYTATNVTPSSLPAEVETIDEEALASVDDFTVQPITADNVSGLAPVENFYPALGRTGLISYNKDLVAYQIEARIDEENVQYFTIVDNILTGERIAEISTPRFQDIAFINDNTQLVFYTSIEGEDGTENRHETGVIDVASASIESTSAIDLPLEFSTNGDITLQFSLTEGGILIETAASGQPFNNYDIDTEGYQEVLASAPDGNVSLLAYDDGTYFTNGNTFQRLSTVTGPSTISASGSFIAFPKDMRNQVAIMEVGTGNEQILTGLPNDLPIDVLSFSPDNTWLFGIQSGELFIADVATGTVVFSAVGPIESSATYIALLNNGLTLVTGSADSITLWGVLR